MIELDGGTYSNIDLYLLAALTLSAVTGQPFEMQQVGLRAKSLGLTPFHLTAIQAIGSLCSAEVKGDLMQSKTLRFTPREAPRAGKMLIDTGAITGRPSPASVVPLIEALIPVLASAKADSLIELRGANTTPFNPSAFWVRETLAPMLHWAGINMGVEIEKWGWYPDGGGMTTLLVEKKAAQAKGGRLSWKEHGDLVALWVLIALSPRLKESIGQQMEQAFKKAVATDRLPVMEIELQRVRSPGPGSGLFMALEFEHVTAGFEAINYRGMSGEQVAQDAVAAMSHYYWSDCAFEPELARALMIPLALTGRESRLTTSDLTSPMYMLADIIPHFLPITITLTPHHSSGELIIQPNS